MNFKTLDYKRPNIKEFVSKLNILLNQFSISVNSKEQILIIKEFNRIFKMISSLESFVIIKNMLDINDLKYEEEKLYFDKYDSKLKCIQKELYLSINNSVNKKELVKYFGKQYFRIMKSSLYGNLGKLSLYVEGQADLCQEYSKILTNSTLEFNNKSYSLSEINGLLLDDNRDIRRQALSTKLRFFKENKTRIDNIFSSLVNIKDRIAKNNGYKSYIDIAFKEMNRTDYNQTDIRKFRGYIYKYIVPLISELQEVQKKRLNIDSIEYYDEKYNFSSNNMFLIGDKDNFNELLEYIFTNLSQETKNLFIIMKENELMDLYPRRGKVAGAYCIYISDLNYPFLIENINGSYEDILNFTHEFGHALQRYMSNSYELFEYSMPTMELGEISSMSMELLVWPYLDDYLGGNSIKYKYNCLYQAVIFLPYAAAIDEFQEYIYKNTNISIEERDIIWMEIEKKYMPWRSYNTQIKDLAIWHQQGHVFFSPFYYIDYALAQISALEIFQMSSKDEKVAWNKYLNICSKGGSESYFDVLKHSELSNPFDEERFKNIIEETRNWFSYANNIID